MKIIKRRLWLSGLTAGAALLLLFWCLLRKEYCLVGAAACVAVLSAILFAGGIRALISARLIVDNCIIGTCPATICAAGEAGKQAQQTVECVFSPFGLLVDGHVYKFGRDGIRLHAVELGATTISAEFGGKTKRWRAELVFKPLHEEERIRLAERINYETGIVPSFSTQFKHTDTTM